MDHRPGTDDASALHTGGPSHGLPQPDPKVMTRSSILCAYGLLDWPTVLSGLRRGWMTKAEIAAFATSEIEAAPATSSELLANLAALTRADDLADMDVLDLVTALAVTSGQGQSGGSDAERRWLFASMEEVERAGRSEDWMVARLQEIYAEFGFPEELRFTSSYNFTQEERRSYLSEGAMSSSPVECFSAALSEIRSSLLEPLDG